MQLLVSDVGESARWYAAALGLVPFAEDLDIGYVALRHRAAKFVVVLTHAGCACSKSVEPVGPSTTLRSPCPDGDTLEAWAAHLTESGIEPFRESCLERRPSLAPAP